MSVAAGRVPGMVRGLYDVDWASTWHAYGSAEDVPAMVEALRSSDGEVRHRALSDLWGKVHHQGSVYPATTASLPFLLTLACDRSTPDRHEIVALLVSIGEHAIEQSKIEYTQVTEDADVVSAAAFARANAAAFVELARDPCCLVRQAAIGALGLFLDDGPRALDLLRDCADMQFCLAERMKVVQTTATLALRDTGIVAAAAALLGGLGAQPGTEPVFRLAAVIHRARCWPDDASDDLVPAVIGLLREIDEAAPPEQLLPEPPPVAPPVEGVPPHIVAAFADLDRFNRRHSLTTDLLRSFHELLDTRVAERTAVLVEQLRSRQPGVRLDAIRMVSDLLGGWRGDHSVLVSLVAGQLSASNLDVAAEAAALLERHHSIAEPAREALATLLAEHGPDTWATTRPHLRRLHQKASMALARLGDLRALPSLLVALDQDVDAWSVIGVVGSLPQASDALVPRLCGRLRHADLAEHWPTGPSGIVAALGQLGDPSTLELITEVLVGAGGCEHWDLVQTALRALQAFGPVAAAALPEIRTMTTVADQRTRVAAITALLAVGGDNDEVLPLAVALLETGEPGEACDVLGRLGPAAKVALPRLRERLTQGNPWHRVHAAVAIWDIGGAAQAPVVLDTLLQAWQENFATGNTVAACLRRMGPAAAPALPLIRAELARPERRGRYGAVDTDEQLRRDLAAVLCTRP